MTSRQETQSARHRRHKRKQTRYRRLLRKSKRRKKPFNKEHIRTFLKSRLGYRKNLD
jgi:hypothetical protein